jgi:ribosome-associated translation inhibitor RaiA
MESAVVFDTDGISLIAEIRLHLASGEVLVASGDGPDHRTALDRAEERLRRQIERASERPRRTRSTQPNQPL